MRNVGFNKSVHENVLFNRVLVLANSFVFLISLFVKRIDMKVSLLQD